LLSVNSKQNTLHGKLKINFDMTLSPATVAASFQCSAWHNILTIAVPSEFE